MEDEIKDLTYLLNKNKDYYSKYKEKEMEVLNNKRQRDEYKYLYNKEIHENDINYDNMLQSTKKSDLKFLDFDQFCDIENDDEENKKTKKKGKKKKKSIRHPKNIWNSFKKKKINRIYI